jgi:hypothetical protein
MAVQKNEIVDIQVNVPSGSTAGSFTTLDNLDGTFRIIGADGYLASANGTGSSRFINAYRVRGGVSGSMFGSWAEPLQALSASSPAGTAVSATAINTGSFEYVTTGDSIKVVSGTDMGALELHFKVVRV